MSLFILELFFFFFLSLSSGLFLGRWLKGVACLKNKEVITNIRSDHLIQTSRERLMINLKSKGFFSYGEIIPNLRLNGKIATYEVVNEKAVRVQAGIMAFLAIFALTNSLLMHNWLPVKIIVVLFFVDFFAKVIIGLKFSIFYQLSSKLVSKKDPEYVGAIQKRFAWGIGLFLTIIMLYLQFVVESKGIMAISLCSLCIIFMTLEFLFGLCVGCKLYYGLIALNILKKPNIAPACSGGVCPLPESMKS